MSEFELRPRFNFPTTISLESFRDNIKQQLADNPESFQGSVLKRHMVLRYPKEQQKIWTPQLSINIEEDEEHKLLIEGVFGPNPNIWLFFMFCYLSCAIVGVFAITIGFSQLSMDKPLTGFYSVPLLAAIPFVLHRIAKFGQQKSKHEMKQLFDFVLTAAEVKRG